MNQPSLLATCSRCGRLCKVGTPTHPDAQLLKKSAVPEGFCANCDTTRFLLSIEPIAEAIARRGANILLDPRVRTQFALMMVAGRADADPTEISWQTIVDNWDLPFPKVRRRGRKQP